VVSLARSSRSAFGQPVNRVPSQDQKWWVGGEEPAERTRVREQLSAETSLRRECPQRRISRREGSQRAGSVRRIGSEMLVLVGHPGLEPGANGLRTQRCTAHKALLLSDSDTRTRPVPVTKGHGSTYSGHRDRLDRAGLLRAIALAREAKAMTEDHARTLVALVEQFGGA
jgi:hypothetical protein